MAYATSNPPQALAILNNGYKLWMYVDDDAIAAVDATDYITNADDLGMKDGEPVIIVDTTNGLCSMGKVTVDADGNGTLTALTAFP